MTVRLRLYRMSLPLREPYVLSFATVHRLEGFLVAADGDGRLGLGEITPLPGYGDETPDGVVAAWRALRPENRGFRRRVAEMAGKAPMFASGIICALETWEAGEGSPLYRSLRRPVPLTALCPGDTPQAARRAAQDLLHEGYGSLKLKIGRGDIGADLDRIRAVTEVAADAELRVDANQGLDMRDARYVARALEALPTALLEQPLPAEAWEAFAELAASTSTALMLDESIHTAAHIDRAKSAGARLVKLKLCKHPGLAATRDLLAHARQAGMDAILGNGVQSAVGNHYEAQLHEEAGLVRACEANGFCKVADDFLPHAMRVERGRLLDSGFGDLRAALARLPAVDELAFTA